MNETIKNLLERRSVRGYKEDLVPEEVLNEILEAGEYSPSGMGQQGTLMVVTQNPELVAKLSKMNADVMGTESDPFYGAPTVVVVFADSNMPTCVENGSLVMGNLMNAAHALGVDSCWIHRAREVFASEEGKALKAEWGVVDNRIKQALKTETSLCCLSDETLLKNQKHHPDLQLDDYLQINKVLQDYDILVQDTEKTVVAVKKISGKNYWLAVKVTRNGKEIFTQTYHLAEDRQLRKLITKGTRLK